MNRIPAIRNKRDSYELIGQPVNMSDVILDSQVAIGLHNYIAQDFMPKIFKAMPERSPRIPSQHPVRELTETTDKFRFSQKIGYNRFTNPDAEMAYFTALSLCHSGLESWSLTAMVARYKHEVNPNKITVRHFIKMFDGHLFDARREVRIIRSHDEETDAAIMEQLENDDYQPLPSEFLAFERPLTEDKVNGLQEHLGRVANRYTALAT